MNYGQVNGMESMGMTVRLIQALNATDDLQDLIKTVVSLIQEWLHCEGVGIRLRTDNDYPYYEAHGFPPEFIEQENYLCSFDAQGRRLCDDTGQPLLECMCGNVLCSRFDPSKPFFTPQGSFWCNSTSQLLLTLSPKERQMFSRGRCITAGYESLALIPLRTGKKMFGLLQLNDHRPDQFNYEKIILLEKFAENVALVISQRQLQKALKENEEKYRVLFECAADAILILGFDKRILAVNQVACDRYDYSESEMLMMYIDQVVTAAESQIIPQQIEHLIWKGHYKFETIHQRKGGSLIPTEVNARRITWNGKPAIIGICRDITERKQALEALKYSESLYHGLVETSQDLIWQCDQNGRYVYLNPAWESVFGYKVEEMLGKEFYFFQTPEMAERDKKEFFRILQFGLVKGWETVHIGKHGNEIHLVFNAKSWTNSAGEVLGTCGTAYDVTERKHAEAVTLARLRLSEGAINWTLDELIQNILDEAERLSKSTIGFFHFVEADQQTLLLQTWSTNTIKTQCTAEGKGQHYSVDKAGVWVDCLHQRRPVIHNDYASLPHRKGLPSGHAPVIRELVVPVIRNNLVMAILGVGNKPTSYNNHDLEVLSSLSNHAWDIVQRKRSEEEKERLEAQNRQLQKNESLGRMAGAIAHHFNNKLQSVMMSLDMAIRQLPKHVLNEFLMDAMHATCQAAEVSSLMLTYLGQTHSVFEPLDFTEICKKALFLTRISIPRHISLETNFPVPGPVINGDANQIQQVLVNLVTNAWESYGKDTQGNVSLRISNVSLKDIPSKNRFPIGAHLADQNFACLEIKDSGCGIADAEIDQLFDPFYSSKFTGRGLGLPVALGIIKAHSGVITVETEGGRGSVFSVFLPIIKVETARKSDITITSSKFTSTFRDNTILLVDDEATLRKAVASAIKCIGFEVLTASDGNEAVNIFKNNLDTIQLVLCDLTMPKMDGWQTISALRKLQPNIPIILTSGYDEAQVMTDDSPERPQAFLRKPYDFQILNREITRVLSQHQANKNPGPPI